MSDRLKLEIPAKPVVIEVGPWEVVSRSGPCKFNVLDVRIIASIEDPVVILTQKLT